MPYDFDKLKPVTCYDCIALRVPQRWDASEEEGGLWGFFESDDENGVDPDTGTLWVAINRYQNKDSTVTIATREVENSITGMAAELRRQGQVVDEKPIEPVDGGYLWYRVDEGIERGEPLRFFRYEFHLTDGRTLCMINFSFVLTQAQLRDPEFQQLAEIMDREIRAAKIAPFAKGQREDTGTSDGSVRLCNFGDQVKIMLPEAMEWQLLDVEEDELETQWAGVYFAGSSQAVMMVSTEDDVYAEDNDPNAAAEEEDIKKQIEHWSTAGFDDRQIARVPHGVILHSVSSDTEGEADSYYNHHWCYVYYAAGDMRELQVRLMLPLTEKDTPPFPELVAHVANAVREAEFPGLS